jgi:transketolase
LFKSWVDKGFNAAGYQNAAEIDTFRSDKPEQYKALVKTIGTTMVTEILNETNKTVSDGDRQRVEELVAAYSDFDGTVASYEVLKMKLSNLEKTIDTGISGAANAMASLETQWKDAKFIGGGTAAETMASIRNFSDRPVSYSFGDRSSKPIPYKDIINMKTRKFTPKYQNIFGKKVPK